MAQFGICCSSGKPSYDVEHVVIVGIFLFVDVDDMVVELVGSVLVEYAEHLFKPVVDMSVQTGYLYNDAVVYKALDKGVWQALGNFVPVVVVRLVVDVEDRLFDVAHFVPQQVDGNHWYGISVFETFLFLNIIGVRILCSKVLAETQRLGFDPGLLQFN